MCVLYVSVCCFRFGCFFPPSSSFFGIQQRAKYWFYFNVRRCMRDDDFSSQNSRQTHNIPYSTQYTLYSDFLLFYNIGMYQCTLYMKVIIVVNMSPNQFSKSVFLFFLFVRLSFTFLSSNMYGLRIKYWDISVFYFNNSLRVGDISSRIRTRIIMRTSRVRVLIQEEMSPTHSLPVHYSFLQTPLSCRLSSHNYSIWWLITL